jgi:hypothetical protein
LKNEDLFKSIGLGSQISISVTRLPRCEVGTSPSSQLIM